MAYKKPWDLSRIDSSPKVTRLAALLSGPFASDEVESLVRAMAEVQAAEDVPTISFATKEELDASLAYQDGTLALVINDATVGNNGTYRKIGESGEGSWVLSADRAIRPDLASTGEGKGARLVAFKQPDAGAASRTLQSKVEEVPVSLKDFYAAGDGAANDTAEVAAAIAAAQDTGTVFVPDGTYNIDAKPTNTDGVKLRGPGKVMAADPWSGREQVNTYAGTLPVATGKEYLWAVYNVMQATNRAIRCYIYGDSTAAGGFNYIDWPFFLQQYLPDAVAARGVRNRFNVTNNAVGGSNLSTWNPTPDVGVNSVAPADLIILKCGINDGAFPVGTRLDTFRTNLRAGLAAIRDVYGGDVGSTAILIVGPNSTVDKRYYKRNHEWYEQLRGIFDSACEDFQCAFFDSYAYLRDSTSVVGGIPWSLDRWLDNTELEGGKPVGLHPRNVGQSWLWGAIVDWMFGDSETFRWRSNAVTNKSAYFGHPNANPTWFPNNYDAGITIEVAQASDGYPITGMLKTERSPDGFVAQYLTPTDESGIVHSRTANAGGNYWGAWRCQVSTLTYSNGWTDFGGVYGGGRAVVDACDVVTLDGLIRPGTTTAGTVMFTLPAHLRPGNQRIAMAISEAGPCRIEIIPNGEVQISSGAPVSWLSLTGINFRR